MRTLIAIAAVGALASTAAFAASEQTPWIGVRGKALEVMPSLVCGSVPCTAATPAELANPPVSDAEAQVIYQRGVYSGVSEHCGLDWQSRNYVPMMGYWRGGAHKNVRQMALIGAIHGIAQGMAKTAMGRIGPCSAELKADMDRRLDFRAPASR
ncbi:MAG: hypothetical protein KA220_11005 [Phenylobacterium sp.]|nr:hypothetical protein [Phenylobacterium sp.]